MKSHESPEWFNNAKLGIFIHWGLYSVPAYAPTELSVETLFEEMGKEKPDPVKLQAAARKWFTNNGYTLWPSRVHNNNMPEASRPVERDIVGELIESVLKRYENGLLLFRRVGLDQ